MFKDGKKIRVGVCIHPDVVDWIETERAKTKESRSGFIANIISELCYLETGCISDECGEVIREQDPLKQGLKQL